MSAPVQASQMTSQTTTSHAHARPQIDVRKCREVVKERTPSISAHGLVHSTSSPCVSDLRAKGNTDPRVYKVSELGQDLISKKNV